MTTESLRVEEGSSSTATEIESLDSKSYKGSTVEENMWTRSDEPDI